MSHPSVLVLAVPYVFASVIGDALRARGAYDVVVPDLRVEEWPTGQHFAAAIASVPVSNEIADVVVELPGSFEQPLKITAGDISVFLPVHIDRPIEDAIDALDQLVLGGREIIQLDRYGR